MTLCAVAQQSRQLDEVTAWGQRPMKEIGVVKTAFDSTMLRESVARSMAEVLTFNSSVFVKSYGRASLSTVAFRGTSPSHTQVTWNGLSLNSPMLGMTDFSTIPSFFIDNASLLHGSSSVTETGGGLGGLVRLASAPPQIEKGWGLQYVQGVGSYSTFDEFLRLTYGSKHWALSTRAAYSSSKNDFRFTNYDKKLNIYDDDRNIIGQYHPTERNRCGDFHDFHLLQEAFYNSLHGDRVSLQAWFTNSSRGLPLLTTDYADGLDYDNRQHDRTLRAVAGWDHTASGWRTGLKMGYVNTRTAYDYQREVADGVMTVMTRSRSHINTIFGRADGEYSLNDRWYFTASATFNQHFVKSVDRNVITTQGGRDVVGYDKARPEASLALSAKWKPIDRLGASVVLRQEMAGHEWAPITPAVFIDGLLWRKANLTAHASVSRNHRFPSLNDLYFLPGGNPDLHPEKGFSYDVGLSFTLARSGRFSLSGDATWFDSRISDWILWLPTTKGFFSPRNVKRVHAYGIEMKLNATWQPTDHWTLSANANYSFTPSINRGAPMSEADNSVGHQLPYVPRHSASASLRLQWQSWSLMYNWVNYSRRYTMSSGETSLTGSLPTYYMNCATLEKSFSWRPVDLSVKLAVNNLFNEHYLTVLSRPMPGTNFELFFAITPRW